MLPFVQSAVEGQAETAPYAGDRVSRVKVISMSETLTIGALTAERGQKLRGWLLVTGGIHGAVSCHIARGRSRRSAGWDRCGR